MSVLRAAAVGLALLFLSAGLAFAIDHDNLDEGRPLRIEDPYPIAAGEWAPEVGAGFLARERSRSRGFFPIELLYGALPNLQLGFGTTIFTDPNKLAEHPRSGDLRLSALYNFNQETIAMPALGLRVSATIPTGTESSGTDVRVKGLLTKSLGRLSLHFNPAYEFLTDVGRAQRSSRYDLAVGAAYPLGAPKFTRLTVLADLFTAQSSSHRGPQRGGAEGGIRYQWTPWTVLDVGVGSEFVGASNDRAPIFLVVGMSVGF